MSRWELSYSFHRSRPMMYNKPMPISGGAHVVADNLLAHIETMHNQS